MELVDADRRQQSLVSHKFVEPRNSESRHSVSVRFSEFIFEPRSLISIGIVFRKVQLFVDDKV